MTQSPSETLAAYCRELGTRARTASLELQDLSTQVKNRWLSMGAESLRSSRSSILEANARDLEMAPSYGLTSSAIDRLTLTPDRLDLIERSLLEIAALPDPVGEIIGGSRRPNGLQIQKVRVPIGVLFFIFESRPNVTADAAAIAIKSGNAIILRGGKEAYHSSYAIFQALERSAVQEIGRAHV